MDLKPTFEHYFPEGTKGGQCGVFAHKLVDFPLVGDTLASKKAAVKKYGIPIESLNGDFREGDVVITSDSLVNGHVLVINNVMKPTSTFRATESNFNNDELIHHTRVVPFISSKIVGVLRGPLTVQIINPSTVQKVLVLWSNIPQSEQSSVIAGINKYRDSVAQKTANTFSIGVDYTETPYQFHTIHVTGSSFSPTGDIASDTIIANPDEIVLEGKRVEDQVGKQYDIVCLIYNDANVIGDPPNHPVENPQLTYGFNVISIPMSWLMAPSNESGQQAIDFIVNEAALFFAHECSHADYFLANTKLGAGQRDRTHDANPYSTDPYLFFVDLLIELKPYWPALSNTAPVSKGEPMIIIHKKSDVNTKFVLENDFKRGYSDFTAFQNDTAGRSIIDLALDDVEFNKIPTSKAVIKT